MIETTNGSRKVTGAALKSLISNATDGVTDIIGAKFDANESYSTGDYVIYNGKLYKFTDDHATGAFDGTDAEEVTVAGEMINDVTVNGTSVVSGGVANIPVADASTLGVVMVNSNAGIDINPSTNKLRISNANNSQVRIGTEDYRPITPSNQHKAVFYGLTKVAGVDMASSSNEVGVYTPAAKAAIQTMLGLEIAKTNVSGASPTIVAEANTRYICGEVTSLDFTPCASGICNVVFTSGSTIAVLTLPQTVKMPEWFEVETNMTYEISIADGVYGAVMSWPV